MRRPLPALLPIYGWRCGAQSSYQLYSCHTHRKQAVPSTIAAAGGGAETLKSAADAAIGTDISALPNMAPIRTVRTCLCIAPLICRTCFGLNREIDCQH